jgi:hypothetical protein
VDKRVDRHFAMSSETDIRLEGQGLYTARDGLNAQPGDSNPTHEY